MQAEGNYPASVSPTSTSLTPQVPPPPRAPAVERCGGTGHKTATATATAVVKRSRSSRYSQRGKRGHTEGHTPERERERASQCERGACDREGSVRLHPRCRWASAGQHPPRRSVRHSGGRWGSGTRGSCLQWDESVSERVSARVTVGKGGPGQWRGREGPRSQALRR